MTINKCLPCRRPQFISWIRKIHWRRDRLPTPIFWPGEFHGLCSPWRHKESDTTERLSQCVTHNVTVFIDSLGKYSYFDSIDPFVIRTWYIFPSVCVIFDFFHQHLIVFRVQVFLSSKVDLFLGVFFFLM